VTTAALRFAALWEEAVSRRDLVMQFETTVPGWDRLLQLESVDILRLDADGRARELCVMIRPASGLQALAAAMAVRLGQA
jgi:hypothetical protein